MGRRVVEATKACRIRRTRGEIGLFPRFTAAERFCAVGAADLREAAALFSVTFFFVVEVLPLTLAGGFADSVFLDGAGLD
jgi:hypothetical protein